MVAEHARVALGIRKASATRVAGVGQDEDATTEEAVAARHQIAHDLASPVRGTSIVADLLAEALDAPSPDLDLLRELSTQLSALSADSVERLAAFAEGRSP